MKRPKTQATMPPTTGGKTPETTGGTETMTATKNRKLTAATLTNVPQLEVVPATDRPAAATTAPLLGVVNTETPEQTKARVAKIKERAPANRAIAAENVAGFIAQFHTATAQVVKSRSGEYGSGDVPDRIYDAVATEFDKLPPVTLVGATEGDDIRSSCLAFARVIYGDALSTTMKQDGDAWELVFRALLPIVNGADYLLDALMCLAIVAHQINNEPEPVTPTTEASLKTKEERGRARAEEIIAQMQMLLGKLVHEIEYPGEGIALSDALSTLVVVDKALLKPDTPIRSCEGAAILGHSVFGPDVVPVTYDGDTEEFSDETIDRGSACQIAFQSIRPFLVANDETLVFALATWGIAAHRLYGQEATAQ